MTLAVRYISSPASQPRTGQYGVDGYAKISGLAVVLSPC